MTTETDIEHLWPYSVRLCFKLLLVVLIAFIIIKCQIILVPLYFSILLSIVLLPLTNFLEKIKFPRVLASLFTVCIALSTISFIIYLLYSQIITFFDDIPAIKMHLTEHYLSIQHYFSTNFTISKGQQKIILNNAASNFQDSAFGFFTQTVFNLSEIIVLLLFTLIYTFLILYYRKIIKNFLFAAFKKTHRKNVFEVILETRLIIKKYMVGLLIEMVIISTTNTIILLLIGIKYAVFLGVLTGMLNILPFIGIFTGIIFTVIVSLTTSAIISQIVWIFIGLFSVHFIDSNFLMPRIVGSKVKINALMAILAAVTGGFLIGIPGVFFALPTIAILKIIFDKIESMKPWGILFGDETTA